MASISLWSYVTACRRYQTHFSIALATESHSWVLAARKCSPNAQRPWRIPRRRSSLCHRTGMRTASLSSSLHPRAPRPAPHSARDCVQELAPVLQALQAFQSGRKCQIKAVANQPWHGLCMFVLDQPENIWTDQPENEPENKHSEAIKKTHVGILKHVLSIAHEPLGPYSLH